LKKPHNPRATAAVAIAAAAAPGAADILNAGKGKNYLETLDISAQDGKDFPWGKANGYQWDVMEFAEMSQQSE
jgi:hypothetical protein